MIASKIIEGNLTVEISEQQIKRTAGDCTDFFTFFRKRVIFTRPLYISNRTKYYILAKWKAESDFR